MPTPPPFHRPTALDRLAQESFDVLVIGGGITGCGVAFDAATRGLKTALVERGDFAAGTSSKSSKMVHGGLRYLQQKEIGLVYEALHERQLLLKNAPHLVTLIPFLIPNVTKDGILNPKLARALGIALWLYDLTGGIRTGKLHKRISKAKTLEMLPMLEPDRVASGYLYYDATADDARLTLTVARSAAEAGAAVANYCAVTELLTDDAGAVIGARVDSGGRMIDIHAKVVVNAAGVWSDQIRTMAEPEAPETMRPAKGIHIAVPWEKVRNTCAAAIPVGDGRSIFIIRWDDVAYSGTTDTEYDGPLDNPQCTAADIDYLLAALNRVHTETFTRADVLGSWAGLRPLLAGDGHSTKTADLSRGHKVRTSNSTLITITGGKLTTYRRMASDTVDAVCGLLGRKARCVTKRRPLSGAVDPTRLTTKGLSPHLAHRYGRAGESVAALTADPEMALPLVPGLAYLRAEAIHAVRHEMARTLDDVLTRRTRARLLDADATWQAAPSVAELIAPELGWDTTRVNAEIQSVRASIAADQEHAGLPPVGNPA
ncbi:MAG: glycerol-3-phosphate dehydrogenase/oxidase [Acidimicrobiia bacterium]